MTCSIWERVGASCARYLHKGSRVRVIGTLHTRNWEDKESGQRRYKTVVRAEGGFLYGDKRFKLVDLPGTYSLLSTSADEEVARDFILFGQPSVTIVVVDATRLERNLNLALQVLEITDRAVIALNLIDEAKRHGLRVDERRLARDLGVPVVPMAARQGEGLSLIHISEPTRPY